jgi:hypothetical protein
MAEKVFKVYPENKSLYCEVHIFDTKEEMYAFDNNTDKDYEAKFIGIDHWIVKGKKNNPSVRKTPFYGILVFFKDQCGGGVVSHEMTHATLAWARRKKFDLTRLADEPDDNPVHVSSAEEDFAWVLGNLVSQFYRKYWDTREDY